MMKKLLMLSFLSAFMFSCSSDDDGVGGSVDQSDYFPVTQNAMWFYDFNQSLQGNNNSGNTIIDINGSTMIEGEAYQILDNTTYLIGSMNQIFFKKNLNKEVTIRPMVDVFNEFVDFGDMRFIQNSMQPNAVLVESEAQLAGDAMPIPENESGITGTVTPTTYITIRNRHINKTNNMTVNSMSYQGITHQRMEYDIKMVLDIQAMVEVGGESIPLNRQHELVEQQQYGTLDLFLAKDVGIIKTDYDYSFNDLNLTTNISLGGISIDIADFAPEVLNFNNALDMSGAVSINDFTF